MGCGWVKTSFGVGLVKLGPKLFNMVLNIRVRIWFGTRLGLVEGLVVVRVTARVNDIPI